jgi:glutathione S-transferase
VHRCRETAAANLGCPGDHRPGATTMSLIFYYAPMSTASITELILEELGTPCEKVKLDIRKGETKKPEFLKVNPNGKVPVIVHDGTVIFESSAITMYLGEVFGVEKGLYPGPGPKRGEAMKWIAWGNVTLGEAVGRWGRNTLEWTPAEQRNAKAAEVARKEIDDCLRILDEALDGKSFLLGDYSLADAHVHSFLDWMSYMNLDFSSFKRLTGWSERCKARPACAKLTAASAA